MADAAIDTIPEEDYPAGVNFCGAPAVAYAERTNAVYPHVGYVAGFRRELRNLGVQPEKIVAGDADKAVVCFLDVAEEAI